MARPIWSCKEIVAQVIRDSLGEIAQLRLGLETHAQGARPGRRLRRRWELAGHR